MRTFIELELPPGAKEYVRRQQQDIRGVLSEQGLEACFRWTEMSRVHLTLHFLGETTAAQQQAMAGELAAAASVCPPFSLGVGSLGAFPSARRPRVLWLGAGGELDRLRLLHEQLARIIQAHGFETDARPYSPHLTIARLKDDCAKEDAQKAGTVVAALAAKATRHQEAGSFVADTLIHMRSDLQPAGPVYTPLSTHKLAG